MSKLSLRKRRREKLGNTSKATSRSQSIDVSGGASGGAGRKRRRPDNSTGIDFLKSLPIPSFTTETNATNAPIKTNLLESADDDDREMLVREKAKETNDDSSIQESTVIKEGRNPLLQLARSDAEIER